MSIRSCLYQTGCWSKYITKLLLTQQDFCFFCHFTKTIPGFQDFPKKENNHCTTLYVRGQIEQTAWRPQRDSRKSSHHWLEPRWVGWLAGAVILLSSVSRHAGCSTPSHLQDQCWSFSSHSWWKTSKVHWWTQWSQTVQWFAALYAGFKNFLSPKWWPHIPLCTHSFWMMPSSGNLLKSLTLGVF